MHLFNTQDIHFCIPEDMHPFNCGPDEGPVTCRHCLGTIDDTHDPDNCEMCGEWWLD